MHLHPHPELEEGFLNQLTELLSNQRLSPKHTHPHTQHGYCLQFLSLVDDKGEESAKEGDESDENEEDASEQQSVDEVDTNQKFRNLTANKQNKKTCLMKRKMRIYDSDSEDSCASVKIRQHEVDTNQNPNCFTPPASVAKQPLRAQWWLSPYYV